MPDSPKNLNKKLFGASGEVKAAKTLKKQGFKIVARNYVTPYGEADVIAQKDGEIFVIRPSRELKIGHVVREPEKLQEVYEVGVRDAREQLPEMQRWIRERAGK